jgi:YD repeat-containing protein
MDRRRFRPARHGIAILFLALFLAALLNAQGLRKQAEIQPPGLGRDVGLALTRPLVSVSHFLYLDRPRQELKAAIGRGGDDRIDTDVDLGPVQPLTPPARPAPKPKPKPKPVTPKPVAPKPKPKPVVVPHPKPKPKPKPKAPPKPAFSPSHPLRIWIAGDSLVVVPAQSLERATASRGAIRILGVESQVATGLGRPEVFNWFSRFREVIDGLRPRVAVLSFGSNDDHNYMTGIPAGRSIGVLGSPSWVAEYRRRVAGVTREFIRSGTYVVWLGLPIASGEGWNSAFRVINRIIHGVAAKHPKRAFFLDTWAMFEDPHGRYTQYLRDSHGRLIRIRASDGVHYEPAAGDMIARAVLHQLNKVFDLTGWRPGAQRRGRA